MSSPHGPVRQKQQTQMQDVLKRLSLQQGRQTPSSSAGSPPQAEPSAAPDTSALLVHKLQRVVAEKDADIQQLKRQIQQLSLQREESLSSHSTICSTGLSPEEGDLSKQTAPSKSVSKFGHRLVLPAVGSSMESRDVEMTQSVEETRLEHSGTVEETKLDPE